MSNPPTPRDAEPPMDLEAIRARCEAATPGEWTYRSTAAPRMDSDDADQPVWRIDRFWPDGRLASGPGFVKADAEFVVHARTDLPALLAALSESQRENEELRGMLSNASRVIVAADSITSFVAHQVNRVHLGEENYRELLAASSSCRSASNLIAATLSPTPRERETGGTTTATSAGPPGSSSHISTIVLPPQERERSHDPA